MTSQEQPASKKHLTLSEPEGTSSQSKRELIGNFLSNLAQPSIFNRELNERDFELWEGLLASYSEDEIAYSFDCWGRNGDKWPLPKDLLQIADAYRATNRQLFEHDLPVGRGKLSDSWAVFLAVFEMISDRVDKFKEAKREYRHLNDEEIDGLFAKARKKIEDKKKRLAQ